MKIDADQLYKKLKNRTTRYKQAYHCPLILKVMAEKGRYTAFCSETLICERTFNNWTKQFELFGQCYAIGKILAREDWEMEGEVLRHETSPPGVISNAFEHWRMMGWSRFGIGKVARLKLKLTPDLTPDKHYTELLTQAADGDFTASELKQLMEAINVGLNSHQVIKLQMELDALRSDLEKMEMNKRGNDFVANKGTA